MEAGIASDDDDAPMDDDRHAQTLLAWLEKRSLCRAYIVNRLGLALTWDERMQARKLGFLQQEWFCAMRDAGNQLQENLYTPQNTLEMRLYELISFRGLGRMRRILTEVKNADGKWERYVLMHPPQHTGKDARRRGVQADPALRKWHNEMMGIYVNRPVYSPSPIASDGAIRARARRLLQGMKLHVAVPSIDGFSGAAWSLIEVAKDVFSAVSGRLRAKPPSRRWRLWIGFDGLAWTKRDGLVRWCLRVVDIKGKQNNVEDQRETASYLGQDKHLGLQAASQMGGDDSIQAHTDASVVVKQITVEDPKYSTDPEKNQFMLRALGYETRICLPVGPPGQEQLCDLVQGGDRAAGHSANGLDSCINKKGVCMFCLGRKNKWTDACACEKEIRRTAVLQSLLMHVDPRPRMKGFENVAPFHCPACKVKVTPELTKQEKAELAKLSEGQQKEKARAFSDEHHGAMQHQELVLFMDMKFRATSHLHRMINTVSNSIVATFALVGVERAERRGREMWKPQKGPRTDRMQHARSTAWQ